MHRSEVRSCRHKRRDVSPPRGRADLLKSSTRRFPMKLEATRVRSEAVCPVCKGAVAAHHTTIKVQGMTFHAYCAGYKRRAAA
jgi:hypothetical protein